jgi:hypothetical protein
LGGKAERRLPQVKAYFIYRAPDKTFWFSGERCLWHLVGDDFVRVDLPPEVVNQSAFLQTITADQQGGIWVSFGRHGLYRLANGIWTPFGGRNALKDSAYRVKGEHFGRREGLPCVASQVRPFPTAIEGTDGPHRR